MLQCASCSHNDIVLCVEDIGVGWEKGMCQYLWHMPLAMQIRLSVQHFMYAMCIHGIFSSNGTIMLASTHLSTIGTGC